MFSGIIEEVGRIRSRQRTASGVRLEILAEKITDGVKKGDSVAVNGVCLSVLDAAGALSFDLVPNTLQKTNILRLGPGDSVNLERAMKLGDRVNGHMVTGHIDGERTVKKNLVTAGGWIMDIGLFDGDLKYVVKRGSVAVDGVSLTVGDIVGSSARLFLIPLTLESTNLKLKKTGDYVNVEFDIMAKYSEKSGSGDITMDTLRRTGFSL